MNAKEIKKIVEIVENLDVMINDLNKQFFHVCDLRDAKKLPDDYCEEKLDSIERQLFIMEIKRDTLTGILNVCKGMSHDSRY